MHSAEIDSTEDGWWWVACACGYYQGPFIDRAMATEDHAEHRAASNG